MADRAEPPRTPLPINRALFIGIVTMCVSLTAASTDIYLASMPAIAAALHASEGQVQLTLSAFTYAYAVAQLVYGPLSDRFGRRPVLLAGMGIYVAASVGAAVAGTIELLILIRLLQALGGCAGPVTGRAMVRDTHSLHEAARALAYVAMAFSVTPICAPILGGLLQTWFGWHANFVFMASIGALVFLLVLLILPETNQRRDLRAMRPSRMVQNYRTLLTSRSFLGYAVAGSFSSGAVFSFISGSPFVLIDQLHLSPAAYGPMFSLVALGYASGAFVASRLTPRWGLDGTIVRGAMIGVAAGLVMNGLLLAGVFHPLGIALPMALALFGNGLVMPNLQAGAIGPFPAMAGAASAMLGCMQMIGAATAGAIVGQAHDGTPYPMTLAVLIATIGLLATFWLLACRGRATGGAPGRR